MHQGIWVHLFIIVELGDLSWSGISVSGGGGGEDDMHVILTGNGNIVDSYCGICGSVRHVGWW